jgi:hypothetical protein
MGATCYGGRREAEQHVMLSEVTVHRTMAVCKPFTPLPRPSPCSADVTLQSRSRLLPSGHTILTALCYEGLLDQVHYQLQHCTDVNSRNAQHDTPLLVAVKVSIILMSKLPKLNSHRPSKQTPCECCLLCVVNRPTILMLPNI